MLPRARPVQREIGLPYLNARPFSIGSKWRDVVANFVMGPLPSFDRLGLLCAQSPASALPPKETSTGHSPKNRAANWRSDDQVSGCQPTICPIQARILRGRRSKYISGAPGIPKAIRIGHGALRPAIANGEYDREEFGVRFRT